MIPFWIAPPGSSGPAYDFGSPKTASQRCTRKKPPCNHSNVSVLVDRMAGPEKSGAVSPSTFQVPTKSRVAVGLDQGLGLLIVPLPQCVTAAFGVLEECPPAELFVGRRERELHATAAELAVGLLDVGAVEEQVRVRQSVGDGAPRLIRSAQAEHQQQVLVRRLDLDPALIAIAVIANVVNSMHLVQKSSAACWSSTGTMTFPTRVIMVLNPEIGGISKRIPRSVSKMTIMSRVSSTRCLPGPEDRRLPGLAFALASGTAVGTPSLGFEDQLIAGRVRLGQARCTGPSPDW